jgi:hypothetical protein
MVCLAPLDTPAGRLVVSDVGAAVMGAMGVAQNPLVWRHLFAGPHNVDARIITAVVEVTGGGPIDVAPRTPFGRRFTVVQADSCYVLDAALNQS